VSGFAGTVPGGWFNSAGGAYSFAAGSQANVQAAHHGAMLFSDDTYALSGVGGFTFNSAAPDEFAVRATGGFRFVTGIDSSGNVTNLTSINSSGSLGVRTASPSYPLDIKTSGSPSSQMHITPTGTIASDGRLKDPESIEPFMEGSELIMRLPRPVWFRYRKESGLPSDRRVAAWVAQDVAPIAPFMVRRTKQKLRETDSEEAETLSLNTNELPYILLNSAKEILYELAKNGKRISELEDEVLQLRQKEHKKKTR
jgi:hypothetical protein